MTTAVAAQAAPTACFTADEAHAAHFRVLQQELNVAALNCRTLDPNDPSFSARYNDFVGKFGGKLQDNATALRHHFSRAGGSFDVWMTKVANDAGQRVFTDAGYCQHAWENLDKVLGLDVQQAEAFADTAGTSQAFVPACGDPKPKKVKAKKVKHVVHHSTTSAAPQNN